MVGRMYEYEYERWRGEHLRRQAAGETRSLLAFELAAVIVVVGLGAALRVLGVGLL